MGKWLGDHRAAGKELTMKGYKDDIEKQTEENTDFRRVLYTGHNLQLVLMSIEPGDEIGAEVHDDRDQFFRIEAGEGEITIDDNVYRVRADDAVIVPQGARHNVKSVGSEPLKLYTIYGPPEHIDGTVHKTCAEANAAHEHFDGKTTE
jgi:mannose-6-phosphate isomerase-like protein (cupin superfamily)